MLILILGLVLFLGPHSVRIVPGLRTRWAAALGEGPYRAIYSVISIIGAVMIVLGLRLAWLAPVSLWSPVPGARELALGLNLIAFILLGVFVVPAGPLKAQIGHPLLLATIFWAAAHLLTNGALHDLVLFGALLLWASVDLVALLREEQRLATTRPSGPPENDGWGMAAGFALFVAFLFVLHGLLIGIDPLA